MMRKWMMILMAGLLCLSMAACSSEPEIDHESVDVQQMIEDQQKEQEEHKKEVEDKAIVGTWKGNNTSWTFNEDGLGSVIASINAATDAGNSFYFTAKDGVLTVTTFKDETTTKTNYKIKDNTLTMTNDSGEATYTKVK